jgi:1,2-diacylglycerol 3-alpha-glucosyltransferase
MRIAITGQTYYPGNNGQAIFTIHLAEGLARAGHEVHMLVANSRFRYDYERINGVHVHKLRALNLEWLFHPEAYLGLLPIGQIRAIFHQNPPEIIHLQDHYFLSRDVTLVARGMRIPLVGTNHFLPENLLPYLQILPLPRRLKIWILWKLMLWTYNTLRLVTTPTATAARILARVGIRVPVLPVSCGVDTHQFRPAPPEMDRAAACRLFGLDPKQVTFLYVGRLDREKRIDMLLRGLEKLVQAGRTDLQLAIAGQGAGEGELRGLVRALHIEKYVRFLGYVSNEQLPLLYQTGHIFAMPSPEELQSIATLEAMASGRPVLAAKARALPELVATGQNGYLFAPNQVDDVARGMLYLVERRCEWQQMGKTSRARAEGHSLEKTIRRYEAVYNQVLGRAEHLPEAIASEPVEVEEMRLS